MGLLRRAGVTADRGETGTVRPAAAPARKAALRGLGLLQRSIRALRSAPPADSDAAPTGTVPAVSPPLLSIELADRGTLDIVPFQTRTPARGAGGEQPVSAAAPSKAGRRYEDVLEEVLTAIAALRAGVELPSRLFTALTTLLGVRKGALLLYDPVRLVYAPWAVLGYDQTTLHRLRIPLGANDAWNALANGSPLTLAGAPAIAAFQQYFSARELAGVGRLILAPFIAEEKLIAVLLITEINSPLAGDEDLIACLARAAEAGAPRVHEARAAQVAAAGSTSARPEPPNLKDEPSRFVASIGASRKTVLLLSLSLEEYAKSVLASHEHLDPFRLHEDLCYFLGSFLHDVGKVLSVRQGRFIFALPDFDASELDLFIHQLSLFLHGLFGSNGTPADGVNPRVISSVSWPADGADLGSLVASLSS
jgi:hypothetical protein